MRCVISPMRSTQQEEVSQWARDNAGAGQAADCSRWLASAWRDANKTSKRRRKKWSKETDVAEAQPKARQLVWSMQCFTQQRTAARSSQGRSKKPGQSDKFLQRTSMIAGVGDTEEQEDHRLMIVVEIIVVRHQYHGYYRWRNVEALETSSLL